MRTIEFYSTISGVEEACPIIEAKDFSPKWASKVKTEYIEKLKQGDQRFYHIFQCPGIFDLFKTGYIVPMWHDITIKTNGDREFFNWIVPTADLPELTDIPLVGTHHKSLTEMLPFRLTSLKTIVKINTPWRVVAPRGVKFLMLPIAYPDSFEFDQSIGILDPSVNSEINAQLYWNILQGEHTIKAGTPLLHLIPLSEEKFNFVCRSINDKDRGWLSKLKYLENFTFVKRRNLIKDLYYKHFGK